MCECVFVCVCTKKEMKVYIKYDDFAVIKHACWSITDRRVNRLTFK